MKKLKNFTVGLIKITPHFFIGWVKSFPKLWTDKNVYWSLDQTYFSGDNHEELTKARDKFMEYPKINKKELSKENKVKFNKLSKVIKESISLDVQENELKISKKDIDLLVWNSATCVLAMIEF